MSLFWRRFLDAIPGVVPSTIKDAVRKNEEISERNKCTVDAIDALLEAADSPRKKKTARGKN